MSIFRWPWVLFGVKTHIIYNKNVYLKLTKQSIEKGLKWDDLSIPQPKTPRRCSAYIIPSYLWMHMSIKPDKVKTNATKLFISINHRWTILLLVFLPFHECSLLRLLLSSWEICRNTFVYKDKSCLEIWYCLQLSFFITEMLSTDFWTYKCFNSVLVLWFSSTF